MRGRRVGAAMVLTVVAGLATGCGGGGDADHNAVATATKGTTTTTATTTAAATTTTGVAVPTSPTSTTAPAPAAAVTTVVPVSAAPTATAAPKPVPTTTAAPPKPAPTTTTAAPAPAGPASVDITDYVYSPNPVRVRVGSTITWVNHDTAPHTASDDGGAWNTPTISQGQSQSVRFDTPGTYSYHCTFHPTMKGRVTVVA